MTFSFLQLALICILYLSALFAVAWITERGWISKKIIYHPLTYIFSLGIFASAWSFYGIIDLARNFGYGALAYYLGTGALFLFAPIALKPLIELAKRFQIKSMADLLTFRYHSHGVGGVIALCMLLAMAPLLALQIQAVADTIHILAYQQKIGDTSASFGTREVLAFVFCVVIAGFAMMFGTRHEHPRGLITAMAFESLIKLFGLCAVGLFALYHVFGGLDALDTWLLANPEHVENLYSPVKESSHTLLLVFIATAVAMPHIFHMTVLETPVKNISKLVTWAFPLFLLFMALPVFPILWAGIKINTAIPTEYFPIAIPIAAESKLFTLIAFIAGLSAATGAMIAIAMALSTMILNHWILPAFPLRTKGGIYNQLLWLRRALIGVIILGGYLFYIGLADRFNLTQLALTAFIATLQFLPGVIAVAHWSKGNRQGLIAGLFCGEIIWLVGLFIPMLMGKSELLIPWLNDSQLAVGITHWSDITLSSLGTNTLVFVLVSLLTRQSDEERYSAELCSEDELSHPVRMTLDVRSPAEIVERLSRRIGTPTAKAEVDRALANLGFNPSESRPYALRRLRDEVEANLSGLMGISVASEIMDRQVPFILPESEGVTDINLIESRIHQYRDHLTGLAAELNNLRLYHRRTLEELPMATCSVGKDMEILMWNSKMASLTGIPAAQVTGSHLRDVLDPWGELLHRFAQSEQAHLHKQELELAGRTHWVTLHKAAIPSSLSHQVDGQVILLEDITELQQLENELVHSERLASIGRLAAGVAHEIGNPVTGIACLAQNMKYETEEDEILESAGQILEQTDRVNKIMQSLMSFAHQGHQKESEFDSVSLQACASEAINLLKLQRDKKQVRYENRIKPDLLVRGDSQRLIQIFVNLLSNSRDASPEDSLVSMTARARGKFIELHVTDEGPGIPGELVDQIFEPFFTTKDPGEGTGLGLAMVYSIVEEHQGSIEIVTPADKVLQKGTKFVIKLPKPLESAATSGNTSAP